MNDDDMIRRGDALTALMRGKQCSTDIMEAIAAFPAVTVGVKPEAALILAKEMQAIVAADRWKGRDLSAAPPEKWSHLRPETQQFWIDTATRILAALEPAAPQVMHEDAPAAIIGEIGNQIHNLGCELQNDEDVALRLSDLAIRLWDAAKMFPTEPVVALEPTPAPDADAIREAALQLAVTAARQALVDAAHAHRADKPTSSAMFKAETYATNAILALIPPKVAADDHA